MNELKEIYKLYLSYKCTLKSPYYKRDFEDIRIGELKKKLKERDIKLKFIFTKCKQKIASLIEKYDFFLVYTDHIPPSPENGP